MKVTLQRVSRRPGWPLALILVTGAWLALVGAVTLWSAWTHRDVCLCPLKGLTGLPCAGCGTTRAVLSLLHGDFYRAVRWNPLMTVVLCVFAASLLVRLAARRRLQIHLGPRHEKIVLIVAGGLLAANWAFLICQGR